MPTKMATASLVGEVAPLGAPSIAELARALRNDPDLIYQYVRNNIAYYPIWGVQKGALGAVLDNAGTAFDQAALMVALLQQAGFTASYVSGQISLTGAQVHDWLGVDTTGNESDCAVRDLFRSGGVPINDRAYCYSATRLTTIKLGHVWVKVIIDGTAYYFDPSFKPLVSKPGIDLVATSGYVAGNYLADAKLGATQTADYIQNLNRTAVRNNLAGYAGNLATYLRTHRPTATLDDLIGGQIIVPHAGGSLRQTDLPYRDAAVEVTEWTAIPDVYRPTLKIQFSGVDRTFTSDALYGQRLSVTFNASMQPVLKLNGVVQATGTAVAANAGVSIALTVDHPYPAHQEFSQQIKAGTANAYVIGTGWGAAGRGLVEQFRRGLTDAKAAGGLDGSEAVLGSSLAILSATWIAETDRSVAITDRLAATNTLVYHRVGIAGYQDSKPYVDLPGNFVSVVSTIGDGNAEFATFYSTAMHSSILESVAVQQAMGSSAVSTVKLMDIAVGNGYPIFDARAANYSTVVQPALVSCDTWKAHLQSAVSAGDRLLLPSHCDLGEGSWVGVGYFDIGSDFIRSAIGTKTGGGLLGGAAAFSVTNGQAATTSLSTSANPGTNTGVSGKTLADPIDLVRGNYLYAHEDINAGVGGFPQALSLQRLYSSAARSEDGPLGRGWTHNLASRATTSSDGFQAMGEDSALDAVGIVVEQMVALDLLKDPAKPLDKMVTATVGMRWFGDQLLDNIVLVRQGLTAEAFVKLPDGSYNAPPGNATKLTKNTGAGYTYETLHKAQLNFATAGTPTGTFLLTTYSHPSGVQAKFTYTGNNLTQVQNSLGRTLTFTTVGNHISQVSDGARIVKYAYDAGGLGNLLTYTDATSKATTFKYDLPGRMTQVFYPSTPTTAFVTNVYDTLGRVKTQTNANGKIYEYFFAGGRTEEVAPDGSSTVSLLDAQGKVLESIDAVDRVTRNTYDAQSRLVQSVLPEGNGVEYEYDDATCLTQGRCTHNVKTLRQIPKTASVLPPLVSRFTYESSFNNLETSTDPRSQTTSYTYTARGEPWVITGPADVDGQQPTTTYAYSAYTAAGYPTFYLPTGVTRRISAVDSVTTTTSYNPANKYVPLATVVDAGTGKLNLSSSFVYDGIGNLTRIDGPRTDVADITSLAYDAERRLTQTTNALGKIAYQGYDADGRPNRSASQIGTQWLVACQTYTPSGKLLKSWGPALTAAATTCPTAAAPASVTDYAYDNLDRLMRVTQNLPAGEGGNRITETTYYADGSVQTVKRAVGTPLEQIAAATTYTANGRVGTVADAKGNLTTYQYDDFDRRFQTRYPDKNNVGTSSATDVEQSGFDENGNVTSLRRRDGQSIVLIYDNLNRLVARSYPNSADNVGFAYDLLNRRTAANANSHAIAYTWDPAGRLTGTTAGGRALSYQVDPAGNRTRITWPDGFYVTTDYDALNRPGTLKESGTVSLAGYGYDDLSRRTTVTRGNGTTTGYGYDPQSRLATLSHDLAGTDADLATTTTRNQAGEIVTHGANNPLYYWRTGTGSRSQTANGLNQTITAAGASLGYDGNGNLQSDGTWSYGHDLDNRLISATATGHAANLSYDAVGRLRRTSIDGTTTDLLYDGADLVAEYDGTGTLVARHVHGPGIDEPLVTYTAAGKQWRYADHLGSAIAEADATGNATAIHSHSPFGEPGTSLPSRFGYTGQQYLAELGLYYYKARFYSPRLGRFIETDPVGYADDLNLYAYVGNNPANRSDPTGQIAFFWHFGITYWAARDSGMGIVDSLRLGWNTMMVDKGSQTTAASDANIHAMLGDDQTVSQASLAINGIIANAFAPSSSDARYESLPMALHTTQDVATPLHYLQPWDGGGLNWLTIQHLVADTFPSLGTVSDAYQRTIDVLSNRQNSGSTLGGSGLVKVPGK